MELFDLPTVAPPGCGFGVAHRAAPRHDVAELQRAAAGGGGGDQGSGLGAEFTKIIDIRMVI